MQKKTGLKIFTLLHPLNLVFNGLSYPLTSKQPSPSAAEPGLHRLILMHI